MKVRMLCIVLAVGVCLSPAGASVIPKDLLPRSNGTFPYDPRQQERNLACPNGILPEGKTMLGPGETVCVASRNFPNNYPRNTFQEWRIEGTSDDLTLTVSCDVVDIQASWWCWRDWLIIADNCRARSYCGSRRPSGDLEPCQNRVTFLFFADFWGQRQGFHCSVTASGSPETTTSTTDTSSDTPSGRDCQCGMPNRSNRIVGGEQTEVNEYPWLVGLSDALSANDRPFCGASLYNDEWIVTAAHCAVISTSRYDVLFNMWDWDNGPTNIVRRSVERVVVHPSYSSETLDNDIALMKLSQKVDFATGIKPVCLPSASADFTGQNATTAGWGLLFSGANTQPEIAMEVTVPIRTPDECSAAYPGSITANMLCAGLVEGGKDSCQGDSGGPLTVEAADGSHSLAGIVSWGSGCADPGKFGVYTDVRKYIDWIQETANTGNSCEK
ncbi:trypsin II-P29-like isoform X2 [Penaeus indicus]|uniref:trypsin II-P29-like isoform X1 n=1 Tax=Penaeus indicus TaxID=29960 RepID=UPI00300C0C37